VTGSECERGELFNRVDGTLPNGSCHALMRNSQYFFTSALRQNADAFLCLDTERGMCATQQKDTNNSRFVGPIVANTCPP
jgi:hypothetical protein